MQRKLVFVERGREKCIALVLPFDVVGRRRAYAVEAPDVGVHGHAAAN